MSLEIAVAGCGIGGMAAAIALARSGHDVTIFERFDHPTPVGSGLLLQPTGVAVLSRLGLAEAAACAGAPVRRLLGLNRAGETVLDARYDEMKQPDVFGLGIDRPALFDLLFEAARSEGVTIRTGCEIAGSARSGRSRALRLADGSSTGPFDLVVDALGVRTSLAERQGGLLPFGALWANVRLPEDGTMAGDALEQRYDRARRMIGLLPIGGGKAAMFWSIRADSLEAWRAAGMSAWKAEISALWPVLAGPLEQILEPKELSFARYADRRLSVPVADGIVHIGDAWHSASPQLGQGANMALLDSWALSLALANPFEDLAAALRRFEGMRSGHVRLYQWLTALVTPLFQSDAILPAVLRDVMFAPLARIGPGPALQAAILGGLAGNPLGRLGLEMPDYSDLKMALNRLRRPAPSLENLTSHPLAVRPSAAPAFRNRRR